MLYFSYSSSFKIMIKKNSYSIYKLAPNSSWTGIPQKLFFFFIFWVGCTVYTLFNTEAANYLCNLNPPTNVIWWQWLVVCKLQTSSSFFTNVCFIWGFITKNICVKAQTWWSKSHFNYTNLSHRSHKLVYSFFKYKTKE